jgi:hypothetical protein
MIADALMKAARDLLRPRMLGLVLWPLLGALVLWIAIYFFAWHGLVESLRHLIAYGVSAQWFGNSTATLLSEWIVLIAMVLFLLPLTQATALVVTSTIAMPIMVRDVAARHYPQLERRRGGTVIGSVWNAFVAMIGFVLLWIVTLPLWFFGVPALLLPIALGAWLNERLFRYDALAEHASAAEYARIVSAHRAPLLGVGAVAAVAQMVPLFNLFAPVYAGLCFIHYGLAALENVRRPPL